jgi:hypothetical protein
MLFYGNYDVSSSYVIPDVKDLEFGKKGRELELANGASTTYLWSWAIRASSSSSWGKYRLLALSSQARTANQVQVWRTGVYDGLVVSVYNLVPCHSEQLKTFAQRSHAVVEAMDKINDKYGDFTLTPALMMGMDDTIIDRIAFGGGKELEELYQ